MSRCQYHSSGFLFTQREVKHIDTHTHTHTLVQDVEEEDSADYSTECSAETDYTLRLPAAHQSQCWNAAQFHLICAEQNILVTVPARVSQQQLQSDVPNQTSERPHTINHRHLWRLFYFSR